jgi:hypothetical protein
MIEAEVIERYNLPPAISDLPAIRALLIEETERCRANAGDEPLLRLYCLMLFSRGDVNDALPIWRAKMSNFDAGSGIDIQFVCGAGYDQTKAFLATSTLRDAKEALDYLVNCQAEFQGWTPLGHLTYWKSYYGLP